MPEKFTYCECFGKVWTTLIGSRWIAVDVIDPKMTGSEHKWERG